MTTLSPVGQDALAAVALFNVTNRSQAKALLSTWVRRAELSPADLAAILATYRIRGGAA